MEATKIKPAPKQTLVITPELRQELKNPLGTLIKGKPNETIKKLKKLISEEKPKCIISVGDIVSGNMLKQGIQPNLIIVDNRVMREKSKPIKTKINKRVTVKNPPGTLTPETWLVIKEALKQEQPTQMLVEGEEDLLTLVAVLEAPENSLIVYGQPHEGLVAVKADKKVRERVQQIVETMKPIPKS